MNTKTFDDITSCFETCVLIRDGASSNMTMFKALTRYSGCYKLNKSLPDPHYIKSYFISPFTTEKVFIIVCPSHMVSCT